MVITCAADKHLSEAEMAVVSYINASQEQISKLSIDDIANGAFVSNATVSRAIRKCGFSSLSELKYRLSLNRDDTHNTYTVNRILSKSYMECIETINSINVADILRMIDMIHSARRVVMIANGLTALVAEEFTTYLQYQNIDAWHTADSNVMRHIDRLISDEDLLVIVSVKNTMDVLALAADLAKKKGAKIVTLCCRKGTELEKYSDLVIHGAAQNLGSHLAVDTFSRIGLYVITRTIIEYMNTDE